MPIDFIADAPDIDFQPDAEPVSGRETERAARISALGEARRETDSSRGWLSFWESTEGILKPLLSFSPAAIVEQAEKGIEAGATLLAGEPKQLLVKPSEIMRRPLREIPQVPPAETIPGQIGAGAANAVIDFANFLQTPEGASFLGIGALEKAVQRQIAGVISAGMAAHAPEQFNAAVDAAQRGNIQEASKQTVAFLGQTSLAALAGKTATRPKTILQDVAPETADAMRAERRAVNIMAPGTLRPQELRTFEAPRPEPPAEMVSTEGLFPKTPELPLPPDLPKLDIREIVIEEPSRIIPVERGTVRGEAESGRVSFRATAEEKAGEVPEMTAEAIAREKAQDAAFVEEQLRQLTQAVAKAEPTQVVPITRELIFKALSDFAEQHGQRRVIPVRASLLEGAFDRLKQELGFTEEQLVQVEQGLKRLEVAGGRPEKIGGEVSFVAEAPTLLRTAPDVSQEAFARPIRPEPPPEPPPSAPSVPVIKPKPSPPSAPSTTPLKQGQLIKAAPSVRKTGIERPWDILDELESIGKIRTKSTAGPGSKVYYGDAYKQVREGPARKLFSPKGQSPDEIIDSLKSNGVLPEAATVDDLWELINSATKNRRAYAKGELPEQKLEKFGEALTKAFGKRKRQIINVSDLSIGDSFSLAGEKFQVVLPTLL